MHRSGREEACRGGSRNRARVACLFSMMSYLSHFSLGEVFILLLVSALGTRKAGTDIGQKDVGGGRGSC